MQWRKIEFLSIVQTNELCLTTSQPAHLPWTIIHEHKPSISCSLVFMNWCPDPAEEMNKNLIIVLYLNCGFGLLPADCSVQITKTYEHWSPNLEYVWSYTSIVPFKDVGIHFYKKKTEDGRFRRLIGWARMDISAKCKLVLLAIFHYKERPTWMYLKIQPHLPAI